MPVSCEAKVKKLAVDMSRTQDTSCFTFLYFHLITSKFLYFQCEARFSEQITLPASGPQCRLALIYLPVVDFAVKCYSHIPYSGKLSREKTFANWWKYDFRGENLRGLLAFAAPKDVTPQISRRKFRV